MRTPDGTTWLPIAESALRHRVRTGTVRQWVYLNHVRSWKLDNRLWVCDDDVADRELAWRKRRLGDTG